MKLKFDPINRKELRQLAEFFAIYGVKFEFHIVLFTVYPRNFLINIFIPLQCRMLHKVEWT